VGVSGLDGHGVHVIGLRIRVAGWFILPKIPKIQSWVHF
jgi:hypothetical protein